MPTIRFSRPFSAGSRPTPDPYDQFLDSHGFYRKHTARDATNLFRVMSEQLYDTQDHHQQVRKDCVNFMIKHRAQYEDLVKGDFDKYIQTMAKAETFGTLTELRAMGYLFKRNIILYEPFNLGNAFVEDTEYNVQPVLRIFHGTHFDSVYEKSYIVDAAFCQSIVYEMLYKKVFKLPDIEYSVETMLHSDINHEPSTHEYENNDSYATHIVFDDGRKFELDRPENTHCILKEKDRCHFHNKDFKECINSRGYEKATLSDKFNSCVRQLLFDGITPFPYKVAKSLDQNIYRNVEFDSWNDERKLLKQKQSYKVGVECMVKVKNNDSNDELLKCRIQAKMDDDTFIVYIDKLAVKRLVPWAHLRPLHSASFPFPSSLSTREFFRKNRNDIGGGDSQSCIDRFAYNLHSSTKSHTKCQRLDNLTGVSGAYDYSAAICNSAFDFEPYTNLSNFALPQSNIQREIIAYPVYTQSSGNMNNANNTSNSSNASSSGGGSNNTTSGNGKSMKSRQPTNNCAQQHQTNNGDGKSQLIALKIDTENNGGSVGGGQYGKNGHESKIDSQPLSTSTTSSSSTTSYQQSYHQMPEQNVTVGLSTGMSTAATTALTAAGHPPMSSYYHHGAVTAAAATAAAAPVYYYQTLADDPGVYTSSDMVMPPGVYAIPAAYQPTTATGAPAMQPGMYAPTQTTHCSVPVSNWPAYTQPMNPQGYVFSAPPPYAYNAIPAPIPLALPFLRGELLRTCGRINLNPPYAFNINGDDLPVNDKASLRFYYNLGVEYYKYLQQIHGNGAVMAMMDGDNVSNSYDQSSSMVNDVDTGSQHQQIINDFQQFNLDTNEIDTPSPSKQRSFNDGGYRRNASIKYKRNDRNDRNDRQISGSKHFQGTYQGPTRTFMKNTPKYNNQSGNGGSNNGTNNYESTPMKDNSAKMHQQQQHGGGHSLSKREQQQQQQQPKDFEVDQTVVTTQFGSHVPPFPYHDQSESYYGPPPGNVYPRMTPPISSRPSSVPGAYHYSNHQGYAISQNAPQCWLQTVPPPVLHQSQMQSHSTQLNQPHSLNTSSASNPSQ